MVRLLSDLATSKPLAVFLQTEFDVCCDYRTKWLLLRDELPKHGLLITDYHTAHIMCADAICEAFVPTGLTPVQVYNLIHAIVQLGGCEGVELKLYRQIKTDRRTTTSVLVSCVRWLWRFNWLYQAIMPERTFELVTEKSDLSDTLSFVELLLDYQEQSTACDTVHVWDALPPGKANDGLGNHVKRPRGYLRSVDFVDKASKEGDNND